MMPKRPPRSNECYALDKDLSAQSSFGEALEVAMGNLQKMPGCFFKTVF